MKKVYSKPDILFDSFSMSVSIAACEVPTNFSMEKECGYHYFGDKYLFLLGVDGCNVIIEDNTPEYDSLCYHTFEDSNRLFSS